jgi:dipeptidyl aminopeptidase/acylaminoacyl peptidase
MQRDIRDSVEYKEAVELYKALRAPGTGQISSALEVHAAPDGRYAVFAGTVMDTFEGALPSRICRVDLSSGDTRVMTFGPNVDRLPKFSPDGQHVAFLSDRAREGNFQLYLLDPDTGAARPTPSVEGWVEYLHWSPDGKRILLGVAGHGADISGGQGAVTSKQAPEDLPSWTPAVESAGETFRWRRAWIYELASNRVQQVSPADANIWEAVWCGGDALAVVTSPGPGEGLWYSARLQRLDLRTGRCESLYAPEAQLGWPAASPSGSQIAIVEAICSDRWVVAGELRLIDPASRRVRLIETHGVDITYTEWRSERELLLAGHRGFETVVGVWDTASGTFAETWSSTSMGTSGFFATVSGLGEAGGAVLIGESFVRAPEIAVIRRGEYRAVRSFALGTVEHVKAIDAVERVAWKAPDGLEIQGWLLLPKGRGPHPLVMNVHGGPVWHWRPLWLARGSMHILMLIKRGYAIFFPNPRGSTGRGQSFVRHVIGDMGGADTYDYLSGIDYLVERGIADAGRLGVTGGSYGGFMTSWLITQDSRFAAAIPVAPATNHVSTHLISNIPHFVSLFLADKYTNPGGKYFQRSPVMHAHKAKTPTLNICGALDRCTPPEEAAQFHSALVENGVESVLVRYPEEGHGVRKFPAACDFAARVVSWFDEHLGAKSEK